MSETKTVGLIYQKIPAIMADMEAVTKDRKSEQGYKFRGIDDALGALKPVFTKHKVFVLPEVLDSIREIGQTKSGSKQVYSVVKMKFTLCAEDGSSVSCSMLGEGQDTGDKSTGKAHSTAFKNMAWEVFCIPTADPEMDIEAPPARPPRPAPSQILAATPQGKQLPVAGPAGTSGKRVALPAGPATGSPKCGPNERKELQAMIATYKWTAANVTAYLAQAFGVKTLSGITLEQYDLFVSVIEMLPFESAISLLNEKPVIKPLAVAPANSNQLEPGSSG